MTQPLDITDEPTVEEIRDYVRRMVLKKSSPPPELVSEVVESWMTTPLAVWGKDATALTTIQDGNASYVMATFRRIFE